MSDELARPEDREVHIARQLEAIANPTRLALLRQLRAARVLGEIRIRAEQVREGLPEERPMARQGVRQHLDRLIDAGFARARPGWRGESAVDEYIVQHQRLFALAEELRQLGELRPYDGAAGVETSEIDAPIVRELPRGRSLVVVHGLSEGRAFTFDATASEWFVGRQRGLLATLDYDPYVSTIHARLFLREGAMQIENVAGSRNGTYVNWVPLKDGAAEPLRHGDVIGVGKSLLLYRE